MKIERTKNAINGTITGIAVKSLQLLFPFVIRTIFIRTLGIDYLGLNSLFSSILQVLNLAELGVSSALVFSMYKPIAEDDKEKICELMNLYRHYYRLIGIFILVVGLILTPFLHLLISGDVPSDINLYVIYLMNLASTVLSYWMFAYRNALFSAHQRIDIVNIISFIVSACTYIIQIAGLVVYRNYYFYLIISIISQIVLNIITAIISKKVYPDYIPEGHISKNEQKMINEKVRDLFTAKIGVVVNTAADTLVISSFLGLETVAIYQNYYYIVSSIMAFFNIFFAACTAGIGNSLVTDDDDANRTLLYNLDHVLFFALNFSCTCMISLYQPFMKLWVGSDYMLSFRFVILFTIYLFVEEAPRTMLNFKDAGGIWKEDRFRPLITAIMNLVLNLILVQIIGLYGVLLSTILSFVTIAFPWLIRNIDRCLFKLNVTKYVIRYFSYAAVVIVSSTVCYLICNRLSTFVHNNIVDIIIRLAACTIISTVIFIIVYGRSKETKYMIRILGRLFKKND